MSYISGHHAFCLLLGAGQWEDQPETREGMTVFIPTPSSLTLLVWLCDLQAKVTTPLGQTS